MVVRILLNSCVNESCRVIDEMRDTMDACVLGWMFLNRPHLDIPNATCAIYLGQLIFFDIQINPSAMA